MALPDSKKTSAISESQVTSLQLGWGKFRKPDVPIMAFMALAARLPGRFQPGSLEADNFADFAEANGPMPRHFAQCDAATIQRLPRSSNHGQFLALAAVRHGAKNHWPPEMWQRSNIPGWSDFPRKCYARHLETRGTVTF